MKYKWLAFSAMTLELCCSVAHASDAASLIPEQKPGFTFSITGLYLQPSASNLQYAVSTTALPLPAPNWQQDLLSPGYSPAFDLGLQYNLENGNEVVKFGWLHVGSNDSASANSSSGVTVGPPYYYGPDEQVVEGTGATSTVKMNVDEGTLVLEHAIKLTPNIQVAPFIGLSADHLKEDISNNYWGTNITGGNSYAYTQTVHSKSTFSGIGPRLGLDGSYFITNRLAVTGDMAFDLLVGVIKYSTDFTSWTADPVGNSTQVNTSMGGGSINSIVPEMDAKIAMLYKIPLDKSGSELTLQAGYLCAVYYDAIHQVLPTTLVPDSWEEGTVAIVNQSETQSSLGLQGPFVKVSWTF